jgi:hypothetical protein
MPASVVPTFTNAVSADDIASTLDLTTGQARQLMNRAVAAACEEDPPVSEGGPPALIGQKGTGKPAFITPGDSESGKVYELTMPRMDGAWKIAFFLND